MVKISRPRTARIRASPSEIGSFGVRQDRWHEAAVDYEASERLNVLGVEVPIMPREQLLAYKHRLDRPVDRADVRGLTAG